MAEAGARRCDKGVRWLFARAEDRARNTGTTVSHALAEMNIALAETLHRLRKRRDGGPARTENAPYLFCDAGLGGLARWLRASGCDAHWVQDISDADLVARAEEINAIIITTDSFLLERRPIAHGRVRAVWVPPTLTKFEQLRLVRAELDLPPGASRCMRCGGELVQVDKEAVKNRIPARTYRWLDEYWKCTRCGQLFWHGTHWKRVSERLRREGGDASDFCQP
ncbi:MAG: Mut7-C RNAse domain-containing protein [Limisphaerales bacterium]